MHWTVEQQAAITHGEGLLAVAAGAGSGKTGVLTERFVHLVSARGVAPERILTITFTRAATAEMKTRIIRKLEARGLREARTRIENAYIHTVHALCRRLLQENPFEAGVAPEPSVLPSPAANQLKREAFHQSLARLLQTLRNLETDPLIDLIADYLNLDSARGDPLQALHELVNRLVNTARHRGLTADDLCAWRQRYPDAASLLQACEPLLPPDISDPLQQQSLMGDLDPALEQRAYAISNALLELAIEYLHNYESLKQRQNALDFDDMQIRALQLLRRSATVRKRYQRMFRYTLVDETQDIDGLQAQIIDILSDGGNLMVVGDMQQSIYGFRHADPRVFEGWQTRAQQQGGRFVRLQENFRSHPDVLAFVELVFAHAWGAQWARLTPTRPPTTAVGEPRVQVWRLQQRNPAAEANLIAQTIRHWVEQQSLLVHDPDTNAERPARYGDFAVLFHQFTAIQHFESAFRAAEVPHYVVGGGRGYWAQYEVRDLMNLLRALCEPEDHLALLSVLRSPFAELSMDALTQLALLAEQADMPIRLCWDAVSSALEPDDAARLCQFREWFEPLCDRVGEWSVATLLARALEASRYESKLLGAGERGKQSAANVRKLLSIALEQPTTHPRDFAQQLELTSRLEQREGNAPTYEETANVVRCYTVHAAKGLEFPVVFVADTAFSNRPREVGLEIDAERGIVALQVLRPDRAVPYEPLPLRLLKHHALQREHAESLRKLYVALTRARDYLIVALTDAPQNPWCKALRGALAPYLDRNASHISLPNGSCAALKTPFMA